jgi:predicted negative regulator of RcsB-dependent stress response
MKRKERHQLKEDEFLTGMHRVLEFFKTRRREMIMAGLALAAVALIFGIVSLLQALNDRSQSRVAGEIISLSAGLDRDPGNLARLEGIAGRGKFNRLAYLELAKYWIGKGDPDKAGAYLQKLPAGRKDGVHYQAEMLKARVLVMKKDYDGAVATYKGIIADAPRDFPPDVALFYLGEAYELKGEKKLALETYQKLQTEHAQSPFGYEASLKAGRLAMAGN